VHRLFAMLLLAMLTLGSMAAHADAPRASACHDMGEARPDAPGHKGTPIAAATCVGCTVLPDMMAAVPLLMPLAEGPARPGVASAPLSRDPGPEPRPPRFPA